MFRNDTVVIAFDGTRENGEIELRYDISEASENAPLTQEIYAGEDCDQTPQTGFISVATDVMVDSSAGGYTPVNSTIDISTATISTSADFYNLSPDETSANITFCVRTDFGSISYWNGTANVDGSVVYSMVKLGITIDLAVGFSSAAVSIEEAATTEQAEDAEIVSDLTACECDSSATTLTCNASPSTYTQNDVLDICVDAGDQAVITSFREVRLSQAASGISTETVDDAGATNAISSVARLDESTSVISTRLISAFFADGSAVTMSGTALLGFAGRRKLSSVNSSNGLRGLRQLQEGGEGAFDIEFSLAPELEEDTAGSSASRVLDFIMPVAMVFAMGSVGLL